MSEMRDDLLVEHAFDLISEEYDIEYNSPVCLAEDKFVFDRAREYLSGCERILDLGCGTGLVPRYLHFPDYTGIDSSLGMLDIARKKFKNTGKHTFILANFETLSLENFGNNPFDAVISTFAMSYSFNPGIIMQGIRRVLCPTGKFFIVLLGHYRNGRHTVTKMGIPVMTYDKMLIRQIFWQFGYRHYGFDFLVGKFPRIMNRLGINMIYKVMQAEQIFNHVGLIDFGAYHIIEGKL